jgi:hypothetical protein
VSDELTAEVAKLRRVSGAVFAWSGFERVPGIAVTGIEAFGAQIPAG